MKLFLILASLCAGLLVETRAATTTNETARPIHYFLFLIDTSSSMSEQKEVTADTMHKLILSGINGRMRPGDVFTIWTFNDRVYTNRYVAQRWIPSRNQDIANRAYRYLRDQRFSRKARIDLALAAVDNVVRRVDAITVFLFTDGTQLLKGTPFDNQVNDIFSKHSEEMRKAKKPFVAVLTGHEKKWLAQSVSPGGGPIYIPPMPDEQEEEAKGTESPAKVAEAKSQQTDLAPPKADIARTDRPKSLTVEEISALLRESQKKQAAQTSTNAPAGNAPPEPPAQTPVKEVAENQVNPAPVAKKETGSIEAAAPTVVPPAATPNSPPERAPVESAATGTANAETQRTPPVAATTQPLRTETAENKSDTSTPVANPVSADSSTHQPPGSSAPTTPQATVLVPEPDRNSQRYLFFALGLLIVAIGSGLLLARNRRSTPQPSLISRSMDKK